MKAALRLFLIVLVPAFLLSSAAFPQSDPDPDSPSPGLVASADGSLLIASGEWTGKKLPPATRVRFSAERDYSIFVRNLELAEGESNNAVRIYLLQPNGKGFELSTHGIYRVDDETHAIFFRFTDRDGYRGQPTLSGESILYATWRGLVSNGTRIVFGRGGGSMPMPAFLEKTTRVESTTADFAGYRWSGDRARFLEQATFGSTTELDLRLRRIGLRTWLVEQFEVPFPTIPYPSIPQMPINPPNDCSSTTNPTCFRERYSMQPVQQWFMREAYYGNAQLRHRTAWALSQIWVTSGLTIQQSSHMIAYYRTLADNAFGNYRNLMEAMTLNPAMGNYLDMATSTKANPNENYPREILQLFSVGLYQLNQDGTIRRDTQNNPIPTYSQTDINNLAKVMTGWSYCNNANCPNATPGIVNYKDPMILNAANHDATEKTLLNYPNAPSTKISACAGCSNEQIAEYGRTSLKEALDNIFHHPNVPPFVSRLLIQHLVTSDPSPAYVQRVADVFANNGQNVRGDLRAVISAILLDPEARGNFKTAPRYGKLREPVQVVTNLGRLFPARSWDGSGPTDGGLSTSFVKMQQNPFYSPTVFNYFAPEYIVPGTTLNAPEFQILNTATGINRTNFLHSLVFEGIAPNATDSLRGISLDISDAILHAAGDATGARLMDFLSAKMMHGRLSSEHRAAILGAVLAVPESNPALRARTAIYLVAASSQWQIQR